MAIDYFINQYRMLQLAEGILAETPSSPFKTALAHYIDHEFTDKSKTSEEALVFLFRDHMFLIDTYIKWFTAIGCFTLQPNWWSPQESKDLSQLLQAVLQINEVCFEEVAKTLELLTSYNQRSGVHGTD